MTHSDPTGRGTRADESRPPVEGPADDDSSNRPRRTHPAGRVGSGDEAAFFDAGESFSFEAQKERAADALDQLAESTRGASRELRRQADRWAHTIDGVAHELQRWADGLRRLPAARAVDEAAGFARRRPGVVLGGAALLAVGVAVYLQSQAQDGGWDEGAFRRS
jgi:hypothetical protein